MPGWEPNPRFEDPQFRRVFARLVTHDWSHGCFLTDGEVLAGMHRLAGIPGVLIHGAGTFRVRWIRLGVAPRLARQ
jgi:proline iminopeptidase